MGLRDLLLGDSGSNESGGHGVSDYDGQPLREYNGQVNGRQITVYSSWREGDPDR